MSRNCPLLNNQCFDGRCRKLMSDKQHTVQNADSLVPRAAITATLHLDLRAEANIGRGWAGQRSYNGDDAEERERKLVEQHGVDRRN